MKDLTKMKKQDLLDLLAEKKESLRTMNFSLAKSKPGEQSISAVKKDIARILTAVTALKD